MSRITQARITDGQTATAADLNTRFTNFSQSAALNEFNTRDAALDLPQMQTDWFARAIYEQTLGEFDLLHTNYNTVAGITAVPSSGHVVQDFSAVNSVLNFGLTGLTVAADEVLRLYWDLSVQPRYTGTPWTAASSFSSYTVPDLPKTGTVVMATSAAVWVIYPEYDITSNALTNFVPVAGQSDFNSNYTGSRRGAALSDCGAAAVIPAWLQVATAAQDGGVLASGLQSKVMGWRGVSGAWHFSGADFGATTIYGIRWIIKGVLHPEQVSNVNYLGHDIYASAVSGVELRYTSGKAQALVMRLS